MKRDLMLALLLLIVAACSGEIRAGGYDIYLLIGQSNMSGRGTITEDNSVPNDRILKFTREMTWVAASEPLHFDKKSCGAGLAMSFARKMADASPERTVALVPCAVGGTPLSRWCQGADLYENAVKRARAALKDGELKGILWHQGCADSNNPTNAETYAARLVSMVAHLRADLAAPNVPFVAGELPRFLARYVAKNGHHHHWPLVNAQLAEAVKRISNAALVSSEGLDDCRDDLIHFETRSLRRFGDRYAEAMFRLQKKVVPYADARGRIARSELESAGRETKPMRTEANSPVVLEKSASADFVVVGGGLSGICAAISAARHGVKTVLVQDRPMLGGNASSEMRMGIMGAHGDQNKEAGILEELQLRNFYYNPLMRYTIWDDVMLSAVLGETNVTLMLNTSVDGVEMKDGRIAAVKAWNGNAYMRWTIGGRYFADCSGDGILRLSGAKFRIGREFPDEFGEDFTQKGGDHRTMGNSILLQLRKTDEHHPFVPPDWAYKFTDEDFAKPDEPSPPKGTRSVNYKRLYPDDNNFWWIEYGGNLDTIADANAIQEELKKIAYGVWAYMKNHPDGRARGYDLDWIGSLPGKRESTRFVGPHILTQHDVLFGGHFEDVVAYGGWTLDDHHPDAFHRKGRISVEYGSPSPFGIPFDCLYSVNVPNLMFAGRDISCTHMGLSATRVMATCAALGQAVGTAAAVLLKYGIDPAQLRQERITELQTMLEDDDCMLPYRWRKVSALTAKARCDEGVEVLRNGIDRSYGGSDNGAWVKCGETTMTYFWTSPQRLSGARIVFDSEMTHRGKRMRKLEATTERVQMPKMMAKAFRVEARICGEWKCVFSDDLNILRFRKVAFASVDADALRLVVTATWGGEGERAHVFALDAL